MTTTMSSGVTPIDSTPVASAVRAGSSRRRISPEAGHALEILGHAIEYLTDEFIYSGGSFFARDPRLEAVQLLMAANRAIYFDCPEVPTLGQRCRSMLRLRESDWATVEAGSQSMRRQT